MRQLVILMRHTLACKKFPGEPELRKIRRFVFQLFSIKKNLSLLTTLEFKNDPVSFSSNDMNGVFLDQH